jgi:8-oxo-dGTP pyrophosphatase MutT (NUDIX family)
LYLMRKNNGVTEVLLQQRKGGIFDKKWESSASGHIDHGEGPADAGIHEAFEEILVKIDKKDLKFVHVIFKEVGGDHHGYFNFSFICEKWEGTPTIGEPDKCSDLKWFDINNLPEDLIPDRRLVISELKKKNYYSEYSVVEK